MSQFLSLKIENGLDSTIHQDLSHMHTIQGSGGRQPVEGQVRDGGRRQDRRDREGEGKGELVE